MISILDVSNIIYGGHYGSTASARQKSVCNFPIGGLYKLFGIIASNLSTSDFALAFDGDSIIKKELLPEYKANRIPNYSVYAEIEMAKELCTWCNIPILFDAKYEADDFIYTLCFYISKLSSERERITVYSDDRDLACCISPNIVLHNVTTNGRCIDFENFTDRVKDDVKLPYNSILLYKLFYGDTSDNYKGKSFPSTSFNILFSDLDSALKPLIDEGLAINLHYSNYDVLTAVLNDAAYLSEDKQAILQAARIVYPYVLDFADIPFNDLRQSCYSGKLKLYTAYSHLNVFSKNDINMGKFLSVCKTLGVPCHGTATVDKSKEIMDLLYLRGQELSSGDFMVAKAKHKPHVESSTPLLNMEFPDELSEC